MGDTTIPNSLLMLALSFMLQVLPFGPMQAELTSSMSKCTNQVFATAVSQSWGESRAGSWETRAGQREWEGAAWAVKSGELPQRTLLRLGTSLLGCAARAARTQGAALAGLSACVRGCGTASHPLGASAKIMTPSALRVNDGRRLRRRRRMGFEAHACPCSCA
eukprot:126524-Chlamydomonas_euryale.AAC.6